MEFTLQIELQIVAIINRSLMHRLDHLAGVKNIFRYLNGTKDLGLFYNKNPEMTLIGYTDAGYLSDPHNARGHKQVLCFYMVELLSHGSQQSRL